ncbi:protein kinase [Streptomyces sp. RY43-2]|uniref:non-specific serine/threonine protein kinase n=1 Tax=Streptomyces macrolidinus TaxID=2952607 RepID=A0ABT0ZK32_9ACTN|nr:serine/threonine-protein kinase [Streptomyces macrolidinus]MCN9243921.1 protein kinase [Streptomyces macrolidinus]
MSEESGRERVIAERYRLLSRLGEGGMGTVWRARDEVLHREVAVKEVRAPAGFGAAEVERLYARLEREAWAAARVANRNVVTVYDVAHEDGRPWIVMELVRGISLADLLDAEGPLTPPRAAAIGAEVLSALRAAHAAGVLHRDVKPSNVLLASDGRVVLTDFGIARVEGSAALTMTGEVVGSPEFLAPELALGHAPGPEADLWSLGVLLYAAVEGWSPFRQDTPLGTLRAVVDEELPPPLRAGPLAGVIQGLLRKNPAERVPAAQAERDLRIIGAGGAPHTGGGTAYAPTVRVSPDGPMGPHRPVPGPDAAPGPAARTPPEPEPRNGRAVAVLVASLAVLVLAVAGLTYALVNRDSGGDGRTGDGGTHSTGAGGDGASGSTTRSSTPETKDASPSPTRTPSSPRTSDSPRTTSPPTPSVSVRVTGSHTGYSGVCWSPDAKAPTFTATFTVGGVPAEVSYRWVTSAGQISAPGWTTLSFPEGGGRTAQRQIAVTTDDTGGTVRGEVRVEVRGPVKATSGSVPFSITCEAETPTGGASASDE